MSFNIVIPARFDSYRLPGKVLADIAGKPMVQRVYEQALKSGAEQIVIATDHEKVRAVVESFGAECCLTSATHPTGTDRSAEVVKQLGWSPEQIVVGVQADVPLIDPTLICLVAKHLASQTTCTTATLAVKINSVEELLDPNIVKVVLNQQQQAMYFSRAPIPWDRYGFSADPKQCLAKMRWLHHIGIYAYRVSMLNTYECLQKTDLEETEGLEQLRLLWAGQNIAVAVSDIQLYPGVDTEADLERVRHHYTTS